MSEGGTFGARPGEPAEGGYTRFMILSAARTGSTMLAQALGSSPNVRCYRGIFRDSDSLSSGHDNFDSSDLALRSDDPIRFVTERIFRQYPAAVRAVGFKLHYGELTAVPGLVDRLAGDGALRLLHLRRRNLLRELVSLKVVQATGVYLDDQALKFSPAKVLKAIRHPLLAAARLRRRLGVARPVGPSRRAKVTVLPDELYEFAVRTELKAANADELFQEHPRLTVYYEDMVERREEVFGEAQEFLGVEPVPLTVTLRKQNPESLNELVANYDELYGAFKGTPQEEFFD